MSLIDEALKRARHEASRQEAVKRDAARHDGPRPIPKLYADRQASRAPLWAGIATGAAVALLAVVAWLLWGRPPVAPPAAPVSPVVGVTDVPRGTVPAPTAETARVPAAQPVPRPSATAAVAQEPVPAPRVSRPESNPAPPLGRAPSANSVEPPVAAIKPTPPAPRTTQPAAAPSTPTGATQTFVREANLPGGGPRLRLGGIAYSEEAPIALINGAALGKGEVVEGYVVRRIDAAEVELEGPGGRVVLRLK